jgi:undecaprenyl diphosphate synthase
MLNMQIPNHLGIIIDGNRRWAKAKGFNPWQGHWEGMRTLEKTLDDCMKLGIPQVSVYTLSTENLNRPKREVDELFKIFYHYLQKLEKGKYSLLNKYDVKIRCIGDLNRLPPKLVKLIGKVMKKTAKHQKRVLNLLIAYGSHFELTEAVKKIGEKILKVGKVEVTEKDIEANLLVPTPLDLVIRTGGWSRLSNFLLWQASYAELYVTKTLWPAFNKKELIKAIEWYSSIKKNYGK